jgi:hypothetical protein
MFEPYGPSAKLLYTLNSDSMFTEDVIFTLTETFAIPH